MARIELHHFHISPQSWVMICCLFLPPTLISNADCVGYWFLPFSCLVKSTSISVVFGSTDNKTCLVNISSFYLMFSNITDKQSDPPSQWPMHTFTVHIKKTQKPACNICYIDRRGSDISSSFGFNTMVIFTVEPHKCKIWMFPPQPMSIKLGLKKKAEIFKRFPMKRMAK